MSDNRTLTRGFFESVGNVKSDLPIHITLAGVIGVGKSTLADKISELTNCHLYKEKVEDNQDLANFYNEMDANAKNDKLHKPLRTAFPLQISLLSQRLEQHRFVRKSLNMGEMVVEDRSIYEDMVFVKTLVESNRMSEREGQIYMKCFSEVYELLNHPTVIIYLRAHSDICYERILRRGRSIEKISREYISDLAVSYDELIQTMRGKIPIITIDYTNQLDTDGEEFTQMVTNLIESIKKIVQEDEKQFTNLLIK